MNVIKSIKESPSSELIGFWIALIMFSAGIILTIANL